MFWKLAAFCLLVHVQFTDGCFCLKEVKTINLRGNKEQQTELTMLMSDDFKVILFFFKREKIAANFIF